MTSKFKITHLPITAEEADVLFYSEKAKQVAKFINEFDGSEPYAYAIYGDWGAGKSTLMNLVEQSLDRKRCELVKFNPWNLVNHTAIVESLFEEIAAVVKEEKKIFESLKKYSEKIFHPLVKGVSQEALRGCGTDEALSCSVSEGIASVVDSIFFSGSPLSHRRRALLSELKKWIKKGKKVVVLIDELDRLLPDEMLSIFKLIKAYLDFPGIVFLVALDKRSAYDALDSVGVSNKDLYIEKIFQSSHTIITQYRLGVLVDTLLIPALDSGRIKKVDGLYDLSKIYIKSDLTLLKEKYSSVMNYRKEKAFDPRFNAIIKIISRRLTNPRTFIKFIESLIVNWDEYCSKLIPKTEKEVHIAFLIFIFHFLEQGKATHTVFFQGVIGDDHDQKILPDLVGFIKMIGELRQGNEITYDPVIESSLLAINDCELLLR